MGQVHGEDGGGEAGARLRQDAEPAGGLPGRHQRMRALPPEHRPDPGGAVQLLPRQDPPAAQLGPQQRQRRGHEERAVGRPRQRHRRRAVELQQAGGGDPVHRQPGGGGHPPSVQTHRAPPQQVRHPQHDLADGRGRLGEELRRAGPVVRPHRLRLPHGQPGPDRQQFVQLSVECEHYGRSGAQSGQKSRLGPPGLPRQRERPPARLQTAEEVRGLPQHPPGELVRLPEEHGGGDQAAQAERGRGRPPAGHVREEQRRRQGLAADAAGQERQDPQREDRQSLRTNRQM